MTRSLLWSVLTILATAAPASAALVTEVHYVMGTYFRITVDAPDPARARLAMRECFRLTRRLEEQFSRFDPASELSRLNADGGVAERVAISPEMQALLERAMALRAMTDGTFDAGIGALTQLWRTSDVWPDARSVRAAQVDRQAPTFVLKGRTLVRRPGVLLDFDGIAKGWAVDRCVDRLRVRRLRRALLNFGESSLYAIGAPRGSRGWPVAVRGLDDDTVLGRLMLRDDAVSVSSVLGHAHAIGTRRVGHIIDPRNGQPLSTPAIALVLARSATDAEAFSKALLIAPEVLRHVAPGIVAGTLRISGHRVDRTGVIPFIGYPQPRRISSAAEELR